MRSWLFVPAASERKIEKAFASEADLIILDLEDSVAPENRKRARDVIGELNSPNERLMVRVNPLGSADFPHDLETAVSAGARGVMLPKSTSGASVSAVSSALDELGAPAVTITPIATETAASLFTLGTYVNCSPRLNAITWGAEDLAADLGAEDNKNADGHLTAPYQLARSLCLAGAAAAEVQPLDTVYPDFRDVDGLRLECEAARRDGFTGKMAIHPAQISIINEAFTPSDHAIERAKAVVNAFATSETGVTSLDGKMLDRPHLRQAERILARAEELNRGSR